MKLRSIKFLAHGKKAGGTSTPLFASPIYRFCWGVVIPDIGTLCSDMDGLIHNVALHTLSPLGRKTVAIIISSASRYRQFAQIYWTKYLQPL